MSENLINAFKELARFAEAKARGAGVVLFNGHSHLDCTQPNVGLRIGADTILDGYRIKEIIGPTVLRDWTAEDAKKHVGFAYRNTSGGIFIIGLTPDGGGRPQYPDAYWNSWPGEYATPVPGTDPAKWDWKPCKVEVPVEVPVEAPKADSVAVASIRNALTAMATCQDWRNLNRPIIMGWINAALLSLESP